ncbi:MAG: NAD(P)-dependent oxidoreductase [Planctomycetes bacterium]|nr:NAD(P)-dependent oxidoreductase [Planctomycetota bacterium]
MKILITGSTGLLGKALIETADRNYEIVATYLGNYDIDDNYQIKYKKLDTRDKAGYEYLFRDFKPKVVIHTASIGSPDYAEKNKEITWDVNVRGTQNILYICERFDAKFIYISSNGIYDGNKAPYGEEDEAKPINYYGQTKLEGERIVQKAKTPYAIIRPILMYGWPHSFERGNIVTFALSKLEKCEVVNAYDDVYLNPLFNRSCAEAIWKVVKEEKYDVFNIGGAERVTIYNLIQEAACAFKLNQDLIKPVQQGFFNELVKRPSDTSYKTEKMEKGLGIKPLSLKEGLCIMKEIRQ